MMQHLTKYELTWAREVAARYAKYNVQPVNVTLGLITLGRDRVAVEFCFKRAEEIHKETGEPFLPIADGLVKYARVCLEHMLPTTHQGGR